MKKRKEFLKQEGKVEMMWNIINYQKIE